jgi:hypothetical protein
MLIWNGSTDIDFIFIMYGGIDANSKAVMLVPNLKIMDNISEIFFPTTVNGYDP